MQRADALGMTEYVCSDCGCDVTDDAIVRAVCPGCGGQHMVTRGVYEAEEHYAIVHVAEDEDGWVFASRDTEAGVSAWVWSDRKVDVEDMA